MSETRERERKPNYDRRASSSKRNIGLLPSEIKREKISSRLKSALALIIEKEFDNRTITRTTVYLQQRIRKILQKEKIKIRRKRIHTY